MSDSGYHLRRQKKLLCAPTIGGKGFRQGAVHDPLAYYYRNIHHCPGNAGLFSTANDLSRFCRMILSNGRWEDKQILEPETVDMFFTNQAPESAGEMWGLGWPIARNRPYPPSLEVGPKTACISHTGYTGTLIELDRYAGTFMIVLTNRVYPDDSAGIESLRRAIRETIIEANLAYARADR